MYITQTSLVIFNGLFMGASKLQLQKAKYAKKLVNYPWHAFALSGVKVLHQNHFHHNTLDFEL